MIKEWVRMPTSWLLNENAPPLKELKWIGNAKSDNTAALMLYLCLSQNANDEPTPDFPDVGFCKLTYNILSDISGLSRTKVSAGLKVLYSMGLIRKDPEGRNSVFQILNYKLNGGWGKLPYKGFYNKQKNKFEALHELKLRSKVELNSLKVLYLIIALRNNKTNYAKVSYEKITSYTGLLRNDIKSALSLLVNLGLIQVDSVSTELNEFSSVNMYRICHLEVYKHRGTNNRSLNEAI